MTNGRQLRNPIDAILTADNRLTSHIRKTLAHGKMREKNLVCSNFMKFLKEEASRRGCSLKMVWEAFHDVSIYRRNLYQEAFQIPNSGFHHQIYHFLLEHFDGDSRRASIATAAKWKEIAANSTVDDIEEHLARLGHWLEASAALSGFVAYRTNRDTMSDNLLRANAMASACFVCSMPTATDNDKRERWRFELDWMRFGFNRDFVESTPEVDGVLTRAQSSAKKPVTAFEILLFTLWPIVIHGSWVIADLQNFFEAENVPTDPTFDDAKNFLFNHGLRVSASAASRSVTTWQNTSRLAGWLAARSIVSQWKEELKGKSNQEI